MMLEQAAIDSSGVPVAQLTHVCRVAAFAGGAATTIAIAASATNVALHELIWLHVMDRMLVDPTGLP